MRFLPSLSVSLLMLQLLPGLSSAFLAPPPRPCTRPSSSLCSTSEVHPAVEGWPEKYAESSGTDQTEKDGRGPRVMHPEFTVEKATETALSQLDVLHWPTWTTGDKPKWAVGNQNVDKIMPYGELSYVLSGKLEIIPSSTGEPVLVEEGDFVTFPAGFQASWKVLEELTWHYFLY